MTGLLGGLEITGMHLAALLLVVLAFLLLLLLTARARAGRPAQYRPLPPFEQLSVRLGASAESGAPLHLSLGSGGLGGDRTLASLAALQVLEGLADAAVAYGRPPLVTAGDPTLVPVAQDLLRRAYRRQGTPERYDPTSVRLVAPQPVVYAAGAADVAAHERVAGNVALGAFREEVSLIAHAGERPSLPQIAAADQPQALGALYPADASLAIGEELYAGAAQLARFPRYLASLRVQDILRLLIVAVVLLKVLGLF